MSATRTPPDPRALTREELEAAADVLEAVAGNRALLSTLPEAERKRSCARFESPQSRCPRLAAPGQGDGAARRRSRG
jgi:hypothetical protein